MSTQCVKLGIVRAMCEAVKKSEMSYHFDPIFLDVWYHNLGNHHWVDNYQLSVNRDFYLMKTREKGRLFSL